jgi:hypothetical protein
MNDYSGAEGRYYSLPLKRMRMGMTPLDFPPVGAIPSDARWCWRARVPLSELFGPGMGAGGAVRSNKKLRRLEDDEKSGKMGYL